MKDITWYTQRNKLNVLAGDPKQFSDEFYGRFDQDGSHHNSTHDLLVLCKTLLVILHTRADPLWFNKPTATAGTCTGIV